MKKTMSVLAISAAAIAMSSAAMASQTELGFSVGGSLVGEVDGHDAFTSDDAVKFSLKHSLSRDMFLEGSLTQSDIDDGDETGITSLDDLDQMQVGLGLNIKTGNSIFTGLTVGAGYFENEYGYSDGTSNNDADGLYLKTGVTVATGIRNLEFGGEYTYYDGSMNDVDYQYGVATVKASYKVNSSLSLTAEGDLVDSESVYRVGVKLGL